MLSMVESEPSPSSKRSLPGRAGDARLAFERVGRRTVVRTALAHSPLRLLTPRNHGQAAWVYTSSLGGGLVDGDRLSVELDVAEGASALLSSQGSTRVYRSPRGCRNELSARVGEGALLALVPDPTTCFAGARYAQRQDVQLAPGASLVLMDLLTAGRSATGERWAFTHFASTLRVHLGGRALLDERWLLDPTMGPSPRGSAASMRSALCSWWAPRSRTPGGTLAAQVGGLPATPRADLVCAAAPSAPRP